MLGRQVVRLLSKYTWRDVKIPFFQIPWCGGKLVKATAKKKKNKKQSIVIIEDLDLGNSRYRVPLFY